MKKVFSFFLAVIVFVSVVFCSFGSVAVSGNDDNSDYVKGLIISLAAVCGLDFPDWTTAAAFSNDFYNKIMANKTESQLNFLSSISELDYSDINNNFSSATVSPLILQSFEAALVDTYGINIDSDLGDISSSFFLPAQFNFNFYGSDKTTYFLSDSLDLTSLSVGLNLLLSSSDGLIKLFLHYDGSSCRFIFLLNNLYYFSFGNSSNSSEFPLSSSSYSIGSVRLASMFYSGFGNSVPVSGTYEDWYGGFGGMGYYTSSNKISTVKFNLEEYSLSDSDYFEFFILDFLFYDVNGNRLGLMDHLFDESYNVYGDTDLNSVLSYSENCEFTSFSDFIRSSTSDSSIFYVDNFNFRTGSNFNLLGLGLNDYLFSSYYPSFLFDLNKNEAVHMYAYNFLLILYSKLLNYNNCSIGTFLYSDSDIFLDSVYLTKDNNLRDQMQSESVSLRIPYNIDNIIDRQVQVGLLPVPEDVIDDGSNVGGTHGGSGGTFDSPDIPSLDDSTIGDYLSSFVSGIANFFSWIADFVSAIPHQISFPVFGGFIAMVCIGVVALIM